MVVQEIKFIVLLHWGQGRETQIFLGWSSKQSFNPSGIKGFGGKPPDIGFFLRARLADVERLADGKVVIPFGHHPITPFIKGFQFG